MTRLPNLCRQDAEIMARCLRLFNEKVSFHSHDASLKDTCDSYSLAAQLQRRLVRSGYQPNDRALLEGSPFAISKFDPPIPE